MPLLLEILLCALRLGDVLDDLEEAGGAVLLADLGEIASDPDDLSIGTDVALLEADTFAFLPGSRGAKGILACLDVVAVREGEAILSTEPFGGMPTSCP